MRRHRPTAGALVVALYAAIIAIYLAVIPPLQGFDSAAHFNAINYLRQHGRWPAIDSASAAYSYELPQQPPLYYALAAGASAWLPFERADEITRSSDNPYQMTLSPLWTVDIPEAPQSWRMAAWVSRLVSAMGGLLAVIFTLTWVRLLLPAHRRIHTFTVAIVALNPLFVYLSITTSNDAWAVAGATALAWAGAWLARNPRARWAAVFGVGCVCGLALLTKYSAGVGALAGITAFVLFRNNLNTKDTKTDEEHEAEFIQRSEADSPTPNASQRERSLSSPLPRGEGLGVGSIDRYDGLTRSHQSDLRGLRVRSSDMRCVIAFIAGVLLTAGVWYGANAISYGELIPMRQAATALPGLYRPAPLAPAALLAEVPGLLRNYWGVFIGTVDADLYYNAMMLISAFGVLGLLLSVFQRKPAKREMRDAVLICAVWAVAAAIALLLWLRSISFGAHARLLLVASPAIALLLTLGWRQLGKLMPARSRSIAGSMLLGALLLWPLLPLPAFMRNHAAPARVDLASANMDRVIYARYDAGMTIAGIDLPEGPFISPRHDLPLTLYLSSDAGVNGFYTLYLHLVDAQGRVLHAFDGVPFGGRHPTRQWRAGETFADTYSLLLPADFNPRDASLLRLVAGFYPHDQPQSRLIARDGNNTPLGGEVPLAQVRVLDEAGQATPAPVSTTLAVWDNGIALTDATLHEDANRVTVQTAWQARSRMNRDYTLFVHLLDAEGQLIAQHDQLPRGGQLPTTVWQAGELVRDTIAIDVPADKAASWMTAVIGLYDAASGERAKWVSGSATHADDMVMLRRR